MCISLGLLGRRSQVNFYELVLKKTKFRQKEWCALIQALALLTKAEQLVGRKKMEAETLNIAKRPLKMCILRTHSDISQAK